MIDGRAVYPATVPPKGLERPAPPSPPICLQPRSPRFARRSPNSLVQFSQPAAIIAPADQLYLCVSVAEPCGRGGDALAPVHDRPQQLVWLPDRIEPGEFPCRFEV